MIDNYVLCDPTHIKQKKGWLFSSMKVRNKKERKKNELLFIQKNNLAKRNNSGRLVYR
jgi:hypothetical protein